MSKASNTASVPLDASTREALEWVREALTDFRAWKFWNREALAALALIESSLERLEREKEAAEWAETRAARYEEALRRIGRICPKPLGNGNANYLEDAQSAEIHRLAALTPETEQPDFWRPDGRCPEC